MSIQQKRLTKNFTQKLLRIIRGLINKGLIPQEVHPHFQISFYLELQLIKPNQVSKLSFGKPEGFRVFLLENNKLISVFDFFQEKKRIRFSNLLNGKSLQLIVKALNSLERKYRSVQGTQTIQLLHFLWFPPPCFIVQQGQYKSYYIYENNRLKPYSPEKLQHRLMSLIKSKIQTIA